MYTFYRRYIYQGQNSFVILLSLAICAIVLALSVAVPFIISVVRISNRVLSLFGYIQISSIEGLIKNCENYLDVYLSDTPTGKLRLKREQKATQIATDREWGLTNREMNE
jgi:hypothetical protein